MDGNNIGFKGGIPYALDIARLNEAFPLSDLREGRVLTHAELELVIGIKRSQRYYGVVKAWMARQKSSNGLVLSMQPSIGVKVLDPASVLDLAETRTRQKLGQTGKALRIFDWVERARLNDIGQKRLDHNLQVRAKMRFAIETARKDLAIELAPVQSMPKRALVSREAVA
jgi:hypothetical protein